MPIVHSLANGFSRSFCVYVFGLKLKFALTYNANIDIWHSPTLSNGNNMNPTALKRFLSVAQDTQQRWTIVAFGVSLSTFQLLCNYSNRQKAIWNPLNSVSSHTHFAICTRKTTFYFTVYTLRTEKVSELVSECSHAGSMLESKIFISNGVLNASNEHILCLK